MNLNVRAFFELVKGLNLAADASVIALSSEGAVNAFKNYSLVGASKGALESLSRHMAVEFGPRGQRFNILAAGSVLTDAWNAFPDKEERLTRIRQKIPGGVLVTPEEVADVARFLLSTASRGINGQTIVVDKGERIVP
jgi:enoyl-[acyl-carrier protein] reductase III